MAKPEDDPIVTVQIDGRDFTGWHTVDIHLAMDSVASVDFTAPFEPDSAPHRETFRPFTFKECELEVDGDRIFSGRVVPIDPDVDAEKSTVTVGAYALPGVLGDCVAPHEALPVTFQDLDFLQIAKPLLDLYGLEVDVQTDIGARFEKVKLEVDDSVFDFLAKLARQRNFVLGSTLDGDLLCWQSVDTGNPVARLEDGQPPVTRVSPSFDPQSYYSEITGYARAKQKRKKGSRYTAPNPFLTSILRPTAFQLDDTDPGDLPDMVRAQLGRMFAAMASYTVDVATWRQPNGEIWTPNTTIVVEAHAAMIYQPYEFLIRTVDLHQDKDESSARLGLVLPGAFKGETPGSLPWEG